MTLAFWQMKEWCVLLLWRCYLWDTKKKITWKIINSRKKTLDIQIKQMYPLFLTNVCVFGVNFFRFHMLLTNLAFFPFVIFLRVRYFCDFSFFIIILFICNPFWTFESWNASVYDFKKGDKNNNNRQCYIQKTKDWTSTDQNTCLLHF